LVSDTKNNFLSTPDQSELRDGELERLIKFTSKGKKSAAGEPTNPVTRFDWGLLETPITDSVKRQHLSQRKSPLKFTQQSASNAPGSTRKSADRKSATTPRKKSGAKLRFDSPDFSDDCGDVENARLELSPLADGKLSRASSDAADDLPPRIACHNPGRDGRPDTSCLCKRPYDPTKWPAVPCTAF